MTQRVKDNGARTYTAVLTPGEDGWILAQIAEVPEAISQGRTPDEATRNVSEALKLALEWRREQGEELPERAEVRLAPVTVPGS
jgi:predicted RNase H-like HicB family nuclease